MNYFAITETVTGLGSSRRREGKEKGRVLCQNPRPADGKIYADVKTMPQARYSVNGCVRLQKSRDVRGGTFPERVSDAPTRRE